MPVARGLRPHRAQRRWRVRRPRSAAVREYEGLRLPAGPGARRRATPGRIYRYTTALNGFAADLTAARWSRCARIRGAHRAAGSSSYADTVHTPEFLGLTGKNGVWAKHGGAKAGKGVVVGVMDTGIWPQNPSFAGEADVGERARLPRHLPGR